MRKQNENGERKWSEYVEREVDHGSGVRKWGENWQVKIQ